MITPQQALQRVIEHREIFYDEMISLMRQIMAGKVSPLMTAAILAGLRVKKETVGEIAAAATVMRELASKVPAHSARDDLLDVVGTGGDGSFTFNISTATMFVAAAAGVRVAKHGNRSISSKSGSADALIALGVNLDLTPEQVAECIDTLGIGFMFAPRHHGAMKNVAAVRGEMGVRTIFNILGPLTNPAEAPNTLLGVFHPDLVGILVRVMERLGAKHVLTVYGMDGMDEVSLGASTMVGELKNGVVSEYEIHPEDFGIRMAGLRNFKVAGVEESKQIVISTLENTQGPALDIVTLNAGVALYAANKVSNIGDGVERAREVIKSGAARAKLEEFVRFTQRFAA